MQFPSTTSPVKKQLRNGRSRFGVTNYKIIFPLLLQRRRLRPAAKDFPRPGEDVA